MMKGLDSRTSEMQIQISAGVNFYALLLKMPQYSLFLPLSLSICFLSVLWNKIVTGLVIYGNF